MPGLRERARRQVLRSTPGLVGVRWMVAERVRGPSWLEAAEVDGSQATLLADRLGDHVHDGPFTGMELPAGAVCSERWPKLAGTYEEELRPVLAHCLERHPTTAVNVGAAEGYYAVGLARAGVSRVIAVDALARARRRLREVAAVNGVADRIEVRALATRRRLDSWLSGGGLVVMDCEGAEYGLLDPARCPNLARADVLVEIHEFAVTGLTAELTARFAPTHTVELIHQAPRDPDRVGLLAGLDPATRRAAVAEQRPGRLLWAYLEARAA